MVKYNREFIYSNIDHIMTNAQSIDKDSMIDIQDLLSEVFLNNETKFKSVEQLFMLFDKKEVSQKSFDEIDDADWDEFVSKETQFDDWSEMLAMATSYFMREKLFAGLK